MQYFSVKVFRLERRASLTALLPLPPPKTSKTFSSFLMPSAVLACALFADKTERRIGAPPYFPFFTLLAVSGKAVRRSWHLRALKRFASPKEKSLSCAMQGTPSFFAANTTGNAT